MKQGQRAAWIIILFVLLIAMIAGGAYFLSQLIQQTTQQALEPVNSANSGLRTQVALFLNPTPTILPDPITIVHEVRSLARLETIQYSVEKVITAETGQGEMAFLFGDRLLFVGHGVVIAGVDLSKMGPQDIWVDGRVLYVRLPQPEIFVATLDNEKSYVYDRETGLLTHGDTELETKARQVAEQEIRKAVLEDGILKQAQQNAESYLSRLLRGLKYPEVIFISATPQP